MRETDKNRKWRQGGWESGSVEGRKERSHPQKKHMVVLFKLKSIL